MQKEKMFLILDTVYNITSGRSAEIEKCLDCIGCPCEASEAGEYVTLLPYEADYITYRLRRNGRQDLSSSVSAISKVGVCPFLKQGKCSIHDVRPIDCRSYPLVPQFEESKIIFGMSKVCPHWMEINGGFVGMFKRVWITLAPLLDEAWRKNYTMRNRTPLQELSVCTNIDELTSGSARTNLWPAG